MKYIKQNYLKLLQRWMFVRERDQWREQPDILLCFRGRKRQGETHTRAHMHAHTYILTQPVLFCSIFTDLRTSYTLIGFHLESISICPSKSFMGGA